MPMREKAGPVVAGTRATPASKMGSAKPEATLGTQAIRRSLAVLNVFRESDTDLGVTEIASMLDLNVSTVHRIVRALVEEGYLGQNDTDRYYLGRTAVLLGLAAERSLGLQVALPVLKELGHSTLESVNLGVRDDIYALVVVRVDSPQALRFDQSPGTRIPLHASAMGKSLLAFSLNPEAELAGYVAELGGHLPRYTPATITARQALLKELAGTRLRGYSIDDEESIAGVRCVGAPILDSQTSCRAAIAIQAPAIRMPNKRIQQVAEQVVAAAEKITDLLPPEHRL